MAATPKNSRFRRWLPWSVLGCAVLTIAVVALVWSLWPEAERAQPTLTEETTQIVEPPGPDEPKKEPDQPVFRVTISKETTRITEPLRADGYVDYVKALNQHAGKGVTPETNAAVPLCRVIGPKKLEPGTSGPFYKLLGIEPLAAEGDYWVDSYDYVRKRNPGKTPEDRRKFENEFTEQLFRTLKSPWSKRDCPLMAGWLAANERPLRLLVEGTRRPHFYWPLVGSDEDDAVISVKTWYGLGETRAITRALLARALLRADSGRIDDAWADLMACHRLARHVSRESSQYASLVGIAIEQMTCHAEAALVHHVNLSVRQIERFMAELAKLPPLGDLADKFDMLERYIFLDNVRTVAQGGPDIFAQMSDQLDEWGELDESSTASHKHRASKVAVDWDHLLRTINTCYDHLAAAARQPTRAERRKAMGNIPDDVKQAVEKMKNAKAPKVVSETMANLFVRHLLPGNLNVDDSADKAAARLDLTRLALALAAYRAESGSYPAKLADLSPEYLAKVPLDIFSAADFRYRTGKGGYRLWSVGRNGRDDGGMGQEDVEGYEGDGDDLLIATPK
jgi:hypothetical protein